jgi:thymidine kinase
MAKLYFRYSAMNAGKSTALLQVAHNYEENDKRVRLYTAGLDNRFDVGKITSRLGPQRESITYDERTDFYADLASGKLDCVLVDEAQFLLPTQVRQLHRAAHVLGVPVICYGLRSDFSGEPFPGSVYLLTLADSLEEIKNICACGRKATMNPRVDEAGKRVLEGAQIAIEGETIYRQMCGRCFYETMNGKV